MSDSRHEILQALRGKQPPAVPLPDLDGDWIQYGDAVSQFGESVLAVGGQIEGCARADLGETIRHLPCWNDDGKIVSTIDELAGNLSLDDIEDPHELEDVHLAVVHGHFGVAENGAVWVDDKELRHRVVLFIAQHVVLVVPIDEILSNMYQAYRRIEFSENYFGVFISGPSKTADIEQSLVIGAHGARSLHVILVE